jgi:hypothetical protein
LLDLFQSHAAFEAQLSNAPAKLVDFDYGTHCVAVPSVPHRSHREAEA